MLRRSPAGPRAAASARDLPRHIHVVRPEPFPFDAPFARPEPSTRESRLDDPLYALLNTEGALCAGRVWQGDCLLLFTSQIAAAAFANSAGVETGPPFLFSRSRTEFMAQAGRSSEQGFIGALIDLQFGVRTAAFVGFSVDRRRGEWGAVSTR